MTEEQYDQAYLVIEAIVDAIEEVTRVQAQDLDADQKDFVTTYLHENFRFWGILE